MSSEEEPVAWLRRRIENRLALARHAIELGNAAEWTELSSGVLMTIAPDAPQDNWDGVHPLGDSSLTRLMEANDPQDTIARCEAELAILDEHGIVWRDIGWLEGYEGELCEESAEIPVCGTCVPKHSHFRMRADVPDGSCRTVRLIASGYKHWPGFPAAFAA